MKSKLSLCLLSFLAINLLNAQVVLADFSCQGSIGSETIEDNVKVRVNKTCRLIGTIVKGNVKVARNGNLITNSAEIEGNVQGTKANKVIVKKGTEVDGDVQTDQGATSRVIASLVKGNVQYNNNSGPNIVKNSLVEGDIQLFSNRGTSLVTGNNVDGNIQCKSNQPAPIGSGNIVEGNKEDQCSKL